MSQSYRIALALLCIGFAFGGLQQSGMYTGVQLPQTGITMTSSEAEAATNTALTEGINAFTMISLLFKLGMVVVTAILAVLTMGMSLLIYYLPWYLWWAPPVFLGPMWWVYINDLVDWFRGTWSTR